VKKKDLMRHLNGLSKTNGVPFEMLRQGANHELWVFNGHRLTIPRHTEINELTAKGIIGDAEQTLD
jgi:mRNA interferase HicA